MINAGVSGDTAQGGLDRLDWSVPDEASGVIVELGAMTRCAGLDPAGTKRALDAIITRLKARGIAVLLFRHARTSQYGGGLCERFDRIYRDLADQLGVMLDPFFLDGIAGDAP